MTTVQPRTRTCTRIAAAGSALCACLLSCQAVLAQDSTADTQGLPLWEFGVFAGALSTPAYPASSQRNQRALALPFFVYRGDVLRADRGGLGARLLHNQRLEFDIGFSASLPASSDDVDLRRGMPDLGTLIEFGPRLKVLLAEPAADQRLSLELPLRAVLEINGGTRQVGHVLEPKLAYERSLGQDWRIKAAFSLVWGDQQLNEYFYGVPAAYATPGRPAYTAQGGLIGSRLGLDGSRGLGPNLRLFAFARYDLHAEAANRNSPLFAQSQGSSAGLGLTWTLGRSQARASASY